MNNQGLVHGFLFDGKGQGNPISLDEASHWTPKQGTLWIHLDYTDANARDWITEHSSLEPVVVDALLVEESRPRTALVKSGLLLALRGVNMAPGSNPEDMVAIRIWTDGQRIISTRKRRLLSVSDIADALEDGCGPANTSEFLVMLTDRLMARMQNTITDTEDEVADIEEQVIKADNYALRNRIALLRREIIALRRYLAPQREAMNQLQTDRINWLSQNDRHRLQEVTDQLIRYIEELDAVRDRAAVAQEELTNHLNEQMNNRMYVLSLVAGVFLPLGFLTGLLGINVGGIPGSENTEAFWIFCVILTTLVGLQLWIFKRKHWF